MTAFEDFGLDERILKAITQMGFETPTPIQVRSIPVLLEGNDVIGRARTGSGKTAAFGLPLLHRLQEGGKQVRALALAPTRELAIQVAEALEAFAKGLPINIHCIYGGSAYGPQLKALKKGVTIVVGTPGRVIDHMERGTLDLSNVETLVLDEADEMLRMGFIEAVEQVMENLPEDRQIALFSATMPPAIQRIAKRFLNKPVILPVEDDGVEHIEQCYLRVPQRKKLAALTRILMGTARGTTLVFARTRASCAKVADDLAKNGIAADAIHGDLNQAARERVIAKLKSKTLRVLVATDVAARGIDISHISHVVNFDLPTDNETYVHRIGRTARAGAQGVAISFVTPGEKRRLQQLQKKLKVQMNEVFAPGNEDLNNLRRKEIWAELETRLPAPKAMETWLKALKKEFDVSTKDIALAALTLLSEERTIPIDEVTADKPKRGEPRGKLSKEQRVALNEAEIHLTIGRRAGIQIGDVVGAIANETGISGNQIGRISLLDRSTFVGLPKELADRIVSDHPELTVRGAPTKVSLAQGSGHKPKGDFPRKRRDAKSRFKKGPKFRGQNKRATGRKGPGKRNKRS